MHVNVKLSIGSDRKNRGIRWALVNWGALIPPFGVVGCSLPGLVSSGFSREVESGFLKGSSYFLNNANKSEFFKNPGQLSNSIIVGPRFGFHVIPCRLTQGDNIRARGGDLVTSQMPAFR